MRHISLGSLLVFALGSTPIFATSPVARNAAFSAVVTTTVSTSAGSRAALLADWDGSEDLVADRETTISTSPVVRSAISEHTIANGFTENVFYFGTATSKLLIGVDNTGDAAVDAVTTVDLPTLLSDPSHTSGGVTLLNPIAGDSMSSSGVITGLAVNPVADLGDFGLCGTIGEVVYVSVSDDASSFKTRILVFAFTDSTGVTPAGAIQILRNTLSHRAGVVVDEDANLYFQLADLANPANGAAIFRVAERPRTVAGCAANPRINRVIPEIFHGLDSLITLATSTLTDTTSVLTNYSGTATTFGNVVALATGKGNVLYAAVARSHVASDDSATQLTEGPFTNPLALGATPSMIISFADASGAFDVCSGQTSLANVGGTIPVGNGVADAAASGLPGVPGVDNFRVFALGTGPDRRNSSGSSPVFGLVSNTLKLAFQIDYSFASGLVVDDEGKVYVVSGGAGGDFLGEILLFPDHSPADRRADFVDLRGDTPGSPGDGDSDRFDHLFWQPELDPISLTPAQISGLARGFLLHLNRTRNDASAFTALPNGATQGNDATSGAIGFNDFDPSGQVAGGAADDSPLGGFEFTFGRAASCPSPRNTFFLNSNGSITFGAGDTNGVPSVPQFRAGFPKIAPAWFDVNPASRSTTPTTFPIQALGFAGINSFVVRWINVPEKGNEACAGKEANTFSVTLFDDGTGKDENNPPSGTEGPTALRYHVEPNTGQLIGQEPRQEGTGSFCFDYGRMLVLGTAARPVLVGYSEGGDSPLNPPGLCEIDVSGAARAADTDPFRTGLIAEGTEPHVYELFNEGNDASIGSGGEITFAKPDLDLRFEGNDPVQSTSVRQRDLNRDAACFFGLDTCAPPSPPQILEVLPITINTRCGDVRVDILGKWFSPNEVTIVCQGRSSDTGVPLQRPGKTVTTAVVLNGGTVVLVLVNVTPLDGNLVRATVCDNPTVPNSTGTLQVTTTFTAGDNNTLGAFTRTASFPVNLVFECLPITITPGTLPNAELGTPYSLTFGESSVCSRCTVSQMWSLAGALPPGLTFNPATAKLSGTPTGGGVFPITITRTENGCQGSQQYTLVVGHPDLTIAMSHTGDFTRGQAGATYTITVSNAGQLPTSGTVSVTDTLPGGLSATGLSGSGWDCNVGTLTCTRSDALPASSSFPAITLTVNVAVDAGATLTNTAVVSGGGEINTTNDTATDQTTVAVLLPTAIPMLGRLGMILLGLALALVGLLATRAQGSGGGV